MKLIKQRFEILEQKNFSLKGIKKFIERYGRVCFRLMFAQSLNIVDYKQVKMI